MTTMLVVCFANMLISLIIERKTRNLLPDAKIVGLQGNSHAMDLECSATKFLGTLVLSVSI